MKRWLSRRKRDLLECAPINDAPPSDRAMRSALETARTIPEAAATLNAQHHFDVALANLVHKISIPKEAEKWFVNAALIKGTKRSWKQTARHPAMLAIALAMLVLAGTGIFVFFERLHEFPGSETAQRMLATASNARHLEFEKINTGTINLGDYFFMKFQLEHFEVPIQFSDLRARGVRVFEDEDGVRVAQVLLAESGMQFFFYTARGSDPPKATSPAKPNWRFVEGEGWAGAVEQRDGVCFMIAMHGSEQELRAYLADRLR
jgi:hypothetical protein